MSPVERWSNLKQLRGWTVSADFEKLVKRAHLKRHPKHVSYVPASRVTRLSPAETEAYDRLNKKLHDQLRQVSRKHFANVPAPKESENSFSASHFTPFTYQNYDWYGPSYECYIIVLTDFVSSMLLQKFQALLKGEYKNWCIRVDCADDGRFDHDHEIALFSDQVIVSEDAAKAAQVRTRS